MAKMKELTSGKPYKVILLFSIPIFIGFLIQQTYSFVDAFIVGRFLGANSLAALGCTGSLSFMVLMLAQGSAYGFSVITSHRFGAKDISGVRKSIAHSIVLSLLVGIILTLLATIFARPLLEIMDTSSLIIEEAYTYIFIIFLGIIPNIFYNLMTGILRAVGDNKTPLIFLILASILNLVLDLLFILVFSWGVFGAAIATVIGQGLSAIACIIYSFSHYKELRLHKDDFKFDIHSYSEHIKSGLPMGFQFSILSIGMIVVQVVLNNLGGNESVAAVAAFTAAGKVESIMIQSFSAVGTSMVTYVGQNYGAKQFLRVKQGVKQGFIIIMALAIISGAATILFADPLSKLFLDSPSREIVDYTMQYLYCLGAAYPFLACVFFFRNTLQGLGKSPVVFYVGLVELLARSLIAIIITPIWGFIGVSLATPGAWIGATILLVILIYVYVFKNKKFNENIAMNTNLIK